VLAILVSAVEFKIFFGKKAGCVMSLDENIQDMSSSKLSSSLDKRSVPLKSTGSPHIRNVPQTCHICL
jgi:hypothetical protein